MKLLVKRSWVALLPSTALLALFLATAPASALDSGDCEDGSCPTGDIPTEAPSLFDTEVDVESETESEGPGSVDDTNDDDDGESETESEGGAR